MNLDKIVGDNIRGYREKLKLSQEALAVKAKLSSNYLGEVERARETISIRRFAQITKVLKIAPYLFFIPDSYKSDAK